MAIDTGDERRLGGAEFTLVRIEAWALVMASIPCRFTGPFTVHEEHLGALWILNRTHVSDRNRVRNLSRAAFYTHSPHLGALLILPSHVDLLESPTAGTGENAGCAYDCSDGGLATAATVT